MVVKKKIHVPLSLRGKKRYVVFKFVIGESSSQQFKKDLFDVAFSLFGVVGVSELRLELIDFENNKGIIRVANNKLSSLNSIFCFFNKDNCIVSSLLVSGSLKKARLFLKDSC